MDLELKKNHSANHSIKTIKNILKYVMGKNPLQSHELRAIGISSLHLGSYVLNFQETSWNIQNVNELLPLA